MRPEETNMTRGDELFLEVLKEAGGKGSVDVIHFNLTLGGFKKMFEYLDEIYAEIDKLQAKP